MLNYPHALKALISVPLSLLLALSLTVNAADQTSTEVTDPASPVVEQAAPSNDGENLSKEEKKAARKAARLAKKEEKKLARQAKRLAKKLAREAEKTTTDEPDALAAPVVLSASMEPEPELVQSAAAPESLLAFSASPAEIVAPTGGDCTDPIDVNSAVVSNGFAFNLSNTRNQISPITSSNVDTLTRQFEYVQAGGKEKRGAPAVTEQAIFFTQGNQLIAVDRVTGCTYWAYTAWAVVRSATILLINDFPDQGPIIYVGDSQGYVHAVNAQSGAMLWRKFAGIDGNNKSASNHFITGGMQYYAGQLFVPVSSKEVVTHLFYIFEACCETHGLLVAFDAESGDKNWTFHTTEDATISAALFREGPNGVPIWSTPAIDPARNAIYVGTGESYTEPVAPLSDSIISIDMTTGLVNWSFQARDNDAWNAACGFPDEGIVVDPVNNPNFLWNLYQYCPQPEGVDFDFGASPILADNGKILIAGDKGGIVYSLDPDTGALNWKRKVSTGGTLGGIHWGMAVDEWTVYVAASDLHTNKASKVDDTVDERLYLVDNATPGIYALDLFTGGLVWEAHPTHDYEGEEIVSLYSASLSVTNDVLFAGSLDGVVTAFSSYTGAQLWSFDTGIAVTDMNGVVGNGGTIDSVGVVIADDTILVNSGYSSFGGVGPYQAGPGSALFVLKLEQAAP